MDKNLKAAYLKIGRELCEDVNKYPQAFRDTLEIVNGKLYILTESSPHINRKVYHLLLRIER